MTSIALDVFNILTHIMIFQKKCEGVTYTIKLDKCVFIPEKKLFFSLKHVLKKISMENPNSPNYPKKNTLIRFFFRKANIQI